MIDARGECMNGYDLFSRAVSTVQETNITIGDSSGSISLYYPFEGDFKALENDFKKASSDYPDIILEQLPQRVRVIIPESDSKRISKLPARQTIIDIVELVKERVPFQEFKNTILGKYPEARIERSEYMEFDWILMFPSELDDDLYCLTEEFGHITYHRYSRDEFESFGFVIPNKNRL